MLRNAKLSGRKAWCARSFVTMIPLADALLGCGSSLHHPPPPESQVNEVELSAYVRELIADWDPPSISIAVNKCQTLVYEQAFGHADGPLRVPAMPQTTYRWFSVTKPFTAVAILQLAERGMLSLTEPAATYLPQLQELYAENARHITLERLLSHRSGTGDVGDALLSWVHVRDHHDQSDLLEARLPEHTHFETKELDHGHYSNLGYMILGAIVEETSKQSYEAYVTEHILSPLEMRHTQFYYEDPFPEATVHATGSHPDDFMAFMASFALDLDSLTRELTAERYWFRPFSTDQTAPSGLLGTSADMVRFGRMILGRGVLDGSRILSEASIEHMSHARARVETSPVGALPGFYFGDAWFIGEDARGRRVLMHGGQGMAFTSLMMIRPADELVVAFAANGTYVDGAEGLHLMQVLGNVDWNCSAH